MCSLSVEGKFAIVTGAGSGINFAFAKLLLQRGCSVVIGDLALRPEAEELFAQYPHTRDGGGGKGGPSAIFQRTDVTSWPQLAALIETCISSFGRIDIVVPGAGVFEPPFSAFWNPPKTASNPDTPSRDPADGGDGDVAGTYRSLDINLTHPIRLSQLAIGYWTKNKLPGALIHVGSVAGHTASVTHPLYFASKHGLHGFVRSLGTLRDTVGIRVGAVAPGAAQTPLWTDAPDKKHLVGDGTGLETSPETIAEAMLDLCIDPAYGDGTILEVTGVNRRVVPLYNADPPPSKAKAIPAMVALHKDLLEKLKTDGVDV